jgi:hypothetical protein
VSIQVNQYGLVEKLHREGCLTKMDRSCWRPRSHVTFMERVTPHMLSARYYVTIPFRLPFVRIYRRLWRMKSMSLNRKLQAKDKKKVETILKKMPGSEVRLRTLVIISP